jgi:hypothetical protein
MFLSRYETRVCGTKYKHCQAITKMTPKVFMAVGIYIVVIWAVKHIIYYVVTRNLLLPSPE